MLAFTYLVESSPIQTPIKLYILDGVSTLIVHVVIIAMGGVEWLGLSIHEVLLTIQPLDPILLGIAFSTCLGVGNLGYQINWDLLDLQQKKCSKVPRFKYSN